MASDFHCSSCNLAFQVGWDHYHTEEGADYSAASHLACTNCGTAHRVEFGRTDKAPFKSKIQYCLEEIKFFRSKVDFPPKHPESQGLPDKLSAQAPLTFKVLPKGTSINNFKIMNYVMKEELLLLTDLKAAMNSSHSKR